MTKNPTSPEILDDKDGFKDKSLILTSDLKSTEFHLFHFCIKGHSVLADFHLQGIFHIKMGETFNLLFPEYKVLIPLLPG